MDTPAKLNEQLNLLRAQNAPREARYDALVAALIAAGIGACALTAGDTCPEFALVSAEGDLVTSADLLAVGPLVLSFCRGSWCPYCLTEIEALETVSAEIARLGASLVTITAETAGAALALKRERYLSHQVLVDTDHGLGLAFGLIFRVPADLRQAYRRNALDMEAIYGNDSGFLPVPATYVIDAGGIIRAAYVNPEFRTRFEPSEVLAALRSVANPQPA